MTDPKPAKLYKYQSYSALTLTALKSRTLWFGRPSRLNDPYDCNVPHRLVPVTLEECSRLLADKAGAYWSKLGSDPRYVDAAGRPTEAFRLAIERAGQNAMQDYSTSNYTNMGVACFSETAVNPLLWSHYGGANRGICLEFDTSFPEIGVTPRNGKNCSLRVEEVGGGKPSRHSVQQNR